MTYTCPMHPDVVRDVPGRCPKCGMWLVPVGSKPAAPDRGLGPITWKSYLPLIMIIGAIFVVALVAAAFEPSAAGAGIARHAAVNFMAGFFLVFSAFKLVDLNGFAAGYSIYDLLAQKVFAYGYVYPFIELGFGLAMLTGFHTGAVLLAEIVVMSWSGLGVMIKLAKKERFQCVCLGTFLKVPLTYVTLVEDFGMAFLAVALLISQKGISW